MGRPPRPRGCHVRPRERSRRRRYEVAGPRHDRQGRHVPHAPEPGVRDQRRRRGDARQGRAGRGGHPRVRHRGRSGRGDRCEHLHDLRRPAVRLRGDPRGGRRRHRSRRLHHGGHRRSRHGRGARLPHRHGDHIGRPQLPRRDQPRVRERRHHPRRGVRPGTRRVRQPLGHPRLSDRVRAHVRGDRPVHLYRDGRRPCARDRVHRFARPVRGGPRHRSDDHDGGDRWGRRGARRLVHPRTRREAGRRLHRWVRSPRRQADGPRRSHRDRLCRHRSRESGGARGSRGAGRADALGGCPAGRGPARWMSAGFPTTLEVPPDTRFAALLRSGVRRGLVLVFLPVFVAGQAIAWLTYAVSGWYRPWSWFKIGLAETLASVRVTFATRSSTGPGTPSLRSAVQAGSVLEVAIGALAIAVVVLAFRAGREQARGLEARPIAAAVAGAAPALGFAVPMVIVAPFVTLGFPQFGIDHLRPVVWQAVVLPLAVGGSCGAIGGLSVARAAIEARGRWGVRSVGAARGGFAAFWWGLALAFAGFLILAALEPGATGAYARFVGRSGGSGAALVVQHALLLPNQSTMTLATSMGVARLTLPGVDTEGTIGAGLAALVGASSTSAGFPVWYLAFLAIPAAAS